MLNDQSWNTRRIFGLITRASGRPRHLPTGRRSDRSYKAKLGPLTTLIACGVLILTSTIATAATAPKKKLTPLEQGLAYYKGKTITYVAPTTAGTGTDISARAISKEMGQFLGATINVEDISVGGSVVGQDDIAAAAPNGLTIGFISLQTDFDNQISNTPNVNFNLKQLAYIGGYPKGGSFGVTQSSSPFTSFAALRTASQTTPAKLVLAPDPDLAAMEYSALGVKFTPLTGYSSSSLQTTGFLRGDGNLTELALSAIGPEIVAGTVRPLVYNSPLKVVPPETADYSLLKSVPTAVALLKKYPPKTDIAKQAAKYWQDLSDVPDSTTAAPSSTPTDLVEALAAAYKFAVHTTYFKTAQVSRGSLYGFIKPSTLKSQFVRSLAVAPKLKAFIAAHVRV